MSFRPTNLQAFPETIQDLPPDWAHFILDIERFITRTLGLSLTGKRLLAAVSGGSDSTALLVATWYLAKRNQGEVTAAHVNHMLREEAGADAWNVELLCDALKVRCVVESHDARAYAERNAIGVEEAGRDLRYAFLNKLQKEGGYDYVLMGHHQDDLAEDVVMRLIRGVGWPALSGMPAWDPDRRLLRPFLLTPKSQLKDFLVDLEVSWREDASNQDPAYTRNRVRNEIIPLLERENPNFLEAVRRLWFQGAMDRKYLDQEIARLAPDVGRRNVVCLGRDVLESATQPALRLRLYKHVLDQLGPGQALSETLFKLDLAWLANRVDTVFQFPGGKTASISRDGILFARIMTE